MKIQIPDFANKEDLFTYLRENKSTFTAMKKAEMKMADGIGVFYMGSENEKEHTAKSLMLPDNIKNSNKIVVVPIINTTNILDSHLDVHIPGIWNRSINSKRTRLLLKEHTNKFEYVISDKVKAYTRNISFIDLGFQYDGVAECLIYEAEIDKQRNEYMFNQYANGYVNNHSVGMYYVNLFLCMDSDNKYDKEEKENYDKYVSYIANKEALENQYYFWAVTEAKEIEGSAVPMGSNFVTPTFSISGNGSDNPPDDMEDDEEEKQIDSPIISPADNITEFLKTIKQAIN